MLHHACRNGRLEMVEALYSEYGANPDARSGVDGATPLHLAAAGGHVECMRVYAVNAGFPRRLQQRALMRTRSSNDGSKSGRTNDDPFEFDDDGDDRARWLRRIKRVGAGGEAVPSGSAPIHMAAQNGHVAPSSSSSTRCTRTWRRRTTREARRCTSRSREGTSTSSRVSCDEPRRWTRLTSTGASPSPRRGAQQRGGDKDAVGEGRRGDRRGEERVRAPTRAPRRGDGAFRGCDDAVTGRAGKLRGQLRRRKQRKFTREVVGAQQRRRERRFARAAGREAPSEGKGARRAPRSPREEARRALARQGR